MIFTDTTETNTSVDFQVLFVAFRTVNRSVDTNRTATVEATAAEGSELRP